MRARDWSHSPLGNPLTWPQPLRTAVELMLGARQPVYVAWGDDLISLYNDGYLPIVGDKHPHGFGKPFRELWAEIWEDFRPIVEATMAGSAQHFVDLPIALGARPGVPVGWFTFSYTALRHDGRICGFYCAATETTDAVLAKERQRFLLELSNTTRGMAGSEEILRTVSRSLGERLRVDRVTYIHFDEPSGRVVPLGEWVKDVGPLPPDMRLEDLGQGLAALREGKTLRIDDSRTDARFAGVRLASDPIEVAAAVSVPLLKDGRFVALLLVGGREPRVWSDADVALIEVVAENAWEAVKRARAEQILRASEARQSFLLKLSDAIRSLSDPTQVKLAASRVLGERLQANRVFYAEIVGDDWIVVKGYDRGEVPLADGPYAAETYGQWIMQTYRQGRRIVFSDTRTDSRFSPAEQAAHAAIDIIGAVGVPLIKKGELVAILAVHTAEPRNWSEVEIALVEETAERTWAAVERARAEDALRESEEHLKKAVSVGTVGVLFFDLKGRMLDANPALEAMTGYSVEELRRIDWIRLTPPQFIEITRRAMTDLADTGTTTPYEKQWIRKDGSLRWGLFAPTRMSGSGPASQCVEFVIDITASKEADQRKDDFLAMLAHELRNPLAPLRTAAQVLKMSAPSEPAIQRTSGIIERQVGHMTKMLDDLLDVSRVTRGLVQLTRRVVDLRRIIGTAIEQCRSLIEGRAQRLSVHLPIGPVLLSGDEVRLVQVVANVISNASKYSDRGSEIEVSLSVDGNDGVVRVRDNGIGIAPELLPHVFDLFTQADRTAARSQGGLGLGLALVKRLVELHDGTVEAVSGGLQCGSEFIIRLPRRANEAWNDAGTSEIQVSTQKPVRALDILVVDDNRDAADALAIQLEMEGHRVHIAYDPHSALERARLAKPSVMVLDIGLPGMDGYELARQLRIRSESGTATLIALSGYGQEQDRRRGREAGFDHHLVKPVDPKDLSALLESVSGKRRVD